MKFLSKITILFFMITMAFAVVSCTQSSGSSSSKKTEESEKIEETPLTLKFITDGEITIKFPWSTLKYSKNGGALTAVEATGNPLTASISVKKDDRVSFYAVASENPPDTGNPRSDNMNIACSSDCYIYGNIMSLVTLEADSDNWDPSAKTLTTERCFMVLFYNNSHIKNHSEKSLLLPATTLSDECYFYMLANCTSLTSAPELPATTLTRYCYGDLFAGCTNLKAAPELPATVLANGCYENLFSECISITSAPALPVTKLEGWCYSGMFYGCTSITTAPELPATTLVYHCYNWMFSGCTGLTSAPDLPAETLEDGCYNRMFKDCSNLKYIKCLATDISGVDSTTLWVEGIPTSGTFVKAAGADWSGKTGNDGIPSGWTVEDAE